jgi:hypothetical protein
MSDCDTPVFEMKAEDIGASRTFEPLLAGDRQSGGRMAKTRNRLQPEPLEVSLS